MNVIKDKIIYSTSEPKPEPPNQPYIERLLSEINQELEDTGDRDWLVDTETGYSHTISQIEPVSRRVASALLSLGFGPGDVLQTGYSSCLDFYWPVFGAWLCGGTVSLGDPNLSQGAIQQQIQDTGANIVVCSFQYLDKYQQLIQELKNKGHSLRLFVLDAKRDEDLPHGISSFVILLEFEENFSMVRQYKYNPENIACVFWSSGSTGNPKGILHSNQNLHNVYLGKDISPKKILISVIMFHIGGFAFGLSLGVFGGAVVNFIKEKCFSGENWFQVAEKFQPEHVFCGVSQYILISNVKSSGWNLDGIKKITPLGGAVSPGCSLKVLKKVGPQATLWEMYGSTEVMFVSKQEVGKIEFGLLGNLGAGVEVYIQDIKTGEKLDPMTEGKIMVKTKNMMLKYLNRPKDTEEFFDLNGFGYIGDVGYYDNSGRLFFSYRMREVLKVDNYWFGPAEIENLLEKEPDIFEACVWGDYDPKTGNDQVINNAGYKIYKSSEQYDFLEIMKKQHTNLNLLYIFLT